MPGELSGRLPRAAAKALEGVTQAGELWRAEARWWSNLETSGAAMAARSTLDVTSSVGVVGLLATDAWRTRAALQVAARGGGDIEELLDAVA